MKLSHDIYIIVISAGLIFSCIESYSPNVSGYEELMVVEGLLTDLPGYSYVKLSRSYPLDSVMSTPVMANVFIIENDEKRIDLIMEEGNPGLYILPDKFTPSIETQYVLHFEVSKNESYTSLPVILLKTPQIDSIYYEIKSHVNANNNREDYVQLYLDTHDPKNNTRYYRWCWEQVYEIKTLYTSYYIRDDLRNPIRPRTEEEMVNLCWVYDTSKSINISNTIHLSEDRISHLPLEKFEPSTAFELEHLYCLNVRQYALSEAGYEFYEKLKTISEGMGTLFDPQPTQVVGNIKNDQNPYRPVLGLFEASTFEHKRTFLRADQFEGLEFNCSIFPDCELKSADVGYTLVLLNRGYQPLYANYGYLDSANEKWGIIGYVVQSALCADCSIYGITQKPNYWPK